MWRQKVKGIRLSLLYPYSNQVLANGRGDELLRHDQKGCWGRKRLRNTGLVDYAHIKFSKCETVTVDLIKLISTTLYSMQGCSANKKGVGTHPKK